jgi:E3 ubiquitin-protein ligase DOA10
VQAEISETFIQGKGIANITPHRPFKKEKEIRQCVICLEDGVLINPCNCSGYYHKECLTSWI